jgi:spore germination protein YaaH
MIRIFEHPTFTEWKDLVLIDDEKDLIKIYSQDKKLGFPFSEYKTSLKEYGYQSADDFYKKISKRERNNLGHVNIKELEASEQLASEVSGLVKLAKYRNDHGCYNSIIKNDGTLYNDIIERLKEYVTEEKALELIHLSLDYNLERHSVKVLLENGNSFSTWINGTIEEIKKYYIGHKWDIGEVETEDFQLCNKVEFIY